jgi:prepilin-type N-terminal cleavage/methylation domain-containing protein
MKSKQSGFTLIEIAIVLVIIGLLLGGVLKGQELINSAKVKNLANDFKNAPVLLYGYQDKFKAIPGDDINVASHVNGGTVPVTPAGTTGNGIINGAWNSTAATDESVLFWQHVSLAGLSAGGTVAPANAVGGKLGVTGSTGAPVGGLPGSFIVCADNIPGKLAMQLDSTLDDGNTSTGAMKAITTATANALVYPASVVAVAVTPADESTLYTVCQGS